MGRWKRYSALEQSALGVGKAFQFLSEPLYDTKNIPQVNTQKNDTKRPSRFTNFSGILEENHVANTG